MLAQLHLLPVPVPGQQLGGEGPQTPAVLRLGRGGAARRPHRQRDARAVPVPGPVRRQQRHGADVAERHPPQHSQRLRHPAAATRADRGVRALRAGAGSRGRSVRAPPPAGRALLHQVRLARVQDGPGRWPGGRGPPLRRLRVLQQPGRGLRGAGAGPQAGERLQALQAVPALPRLPRGRLHRRDDRQERGEQQAHHHAALQQLPGQRVVQVRVPDGAPAGADGAQEPRAARAAAGPGREQAGPDAAAVHAHAHLPQVRRPLVLGEAPLRYARPQGGEVRAPAQLAGPGVRGPLRPLAHQVARLHPGGEPAQRSREHGGGPDAGGRVRGAGGQRHLRAREREHVHRQLAVQRGVPGGGVGPLRGGHAPGLRHAADDWSVRVSEHPAPAPAALAQDGVRPARGAEELAQALLQRGAVQGRELGVAR